MEALSSKTRGDVLERLKPYINLRSALEDAVEEADIEMVQQLIVLGANVKNGSALVVAARHAPHGTTSLDIMKLLLQNGAKIHGDAYKPTPLQAALSALHGSKEDCRCAQITRFLLDRGCSENSGSQGGRDGDLPPFLLAARHGHTGALQILKNPKSVKLKDPIGRSAFILAADGGAIECLELLLPEFSVDDVDDYGQTALHWAVDKGNEDAISWLLEHGADPAAESDEGTSAIEGYEYLLKQNTDRSSQTIAMNSGFNKGPQKVLEEMGVSGQVLDLLKTCGTTIKKLKLEASTVATLRGECQRVGLKEFPKRHSELVEELMHHFECKDRGSHFFEVVLHLADSSSQ